MYKIGSEKISFVYVIFLACLLLILFPGCAPKPRLAPDERTPENVLKCAQENEIKFETLASLVKLKLEGEKAKFSGTIEFFYHEPGRFSLRPRTPFGIGGFRAAGEGDNLTIYFPGQNEFYQGSFSDLENTSLWSWNIPFGVLLEMILNRNGLSDDRLRYAGREENLLLYEFEDENWLRKYWIDSRGCRLTGSQWTRSENGDVLQIEYADFKKQGTGETPKVITVRFQTKDKATLKFLERKYDSPIPSRKFDLQIPLDAVQVFFESDRK
jgi:outer membrane lipoprotein-sorting protein